MRVQRFSKVVSEMKRTETTSSHLAVAALVLVVFLYSTTI